MKKKTKQIIAVAALAAFIFFTVFGTVGLVISSHHTCEGIHCHICERIAVIKNVVSIMKFAIILVFAALFAGETVNLLASKMPPEFDFYTTVSLKTKLNN